MSRPYGISVAATSQKRKKKIYWKEKTQFSIVADCILETGREMYAKHQCLQLHNTAGVSLILEI